MNIDGRQLPDSSLRDARIRRETLFKSIPQVMKELSETDAGRFVAIHAAGRCVADTREQANEMASSHVPRVVLQIPSPDELRSESIVKSAVELAVRRMNLISVIASATGLAGGLAVALGVYLLTDSGFLAGVMFVDVMRYVGKRVAHSMLRRRVRG